MITRPDRPLRHPAGKHKEKRGLPREFIEQLLLQRIFGSHKERKQGGKRSVKVAGNRRLCVANPFFKGRRQLRKRISDFGGK
jgi:hypothetical protein